jgi:pilus assembly protein CpaC
MKPTVYQIQNLAARFAEHLLAPLLAALVVLAMLQPARADDFFVRASFGDSQRDAVAINVLIGQSRVIRFDQPIGRFSVSNPEVAEPVLVAPDQVLVNGKAVGQVNFIAWDQGGERSVVFDVAVRINLTLVEGMIKQIFPQEQIQLSQANGAVIMSGVVTDARRAAQAEAAVQAAGLKTVNLIQGPISQVPQVQLQVRVAEVNRNRARELGTAYAYQSRPGAGGFLNSGMGPATVTRIEDGVISGVINSTVNLLFTSDNLTAFLRALDTVGALRTLAEPNLIAMDGAQANFLAGGEFPVPILQGSGVNANVTIQFKEFGVRLGFKPTIIDENHIRLELTPEVSTLDFINGIQLGGFTIPALRTRRATTSIELQNGQGFALAGLLDNSETRTLQKVPLIGDIPILGELFRSRSFQKQESELMFIVSVNLVRPIERQALPILEGLDGLKTSSPLSDPPEQKKGKYDRMPGDKPKQPEKTGDGSAGDSALPGDVKKIEPSPASEDSATDTPMRASGAPVDARVLV